MSEKITAENFNPDAMSADDLLEFAHSARGLRPATKARQFFGGTTPKGYVTAFKACRAYADNKATAMKCRERGEIETARRYEAICQRIYDGLPHYAKW